jgi:hypothetical protein
MQYFVGANCGGPGRIAFRADAPYDAWKPEIDYLADTPNPGDCPALQPAYLQYALVDDAWPVWWNGSYFVPGIQTVISEHYDNTGISNATFMERTYYAYQLGLVRWEAWGKSKRSPSSRSLYELSSDRQRSGPLGQQTVDNVCMPTVDEYTVRCTILLMDG